MKPIVTTILLLALAINATWAQKMNFGGNTTSVKATENGYLFEVSLYNTAGVQTEIKPITGTRIEVYNNTTDEEIMVLENHKAPSFQVPFEKGNHYSILIRKLGYFNKRMEAYINVKGCILCFEGVGKVEPNISDAMTDGNQQGVLLAEVNMDRIELNRIIQIENIYYDLDKWVIRPDAAKELDKVIIVLKDHPSIVMELGSHTDSRGRDEYNLSLSEKRAQSAVSYIVEKGNISPERIQAKGYGETQLTNNCGNGVSCNDRRHQRNRRTQLTVTGINEDILVNYRSLAEIIKGERIGTQPVDRTEGIGVSDF